VNYPKENKMRRIIALAFPLFLFLALPNPALSDVGIGFGTHYYSIPESLYKEVYKDGNLMLTVSTILELTKKFEVRLEISHFKKKGKTVLKQEPVNLTLLPISAGIRYRILDTKEISPYIGGGVVYVVYFEDVPESFGDDVSDSAIGFHAEGGVYFHLGKRFLLDINGRYVISNAQPFEKKIGLGGLKAGIGLEYRF
jgi:opacity protein-like surface antigen